MTSVRKEQVKAFWESEACGERYGADQDRRRYELEPEILDFADFESARGKRLLEIGVGMGADFVRWVRAGAMATGVDFTERSVTLTRARLQQEGLAADLLVSDAESLPFADGSFDVVYSWGVLHHTTDPSRAVRELRRVVAPNGQIKMMLYHRYSWVALAAWCRFSLLRGRPFDSLTRAVANVESPGTRAFTPREVHSLLRDLRGVTVTPRLTRWDRTLAPVVANVFRDRFGWFLLIRATAPGH